MDVLLAAATATDGAKLDPLVLAMFSIGGVFVTAGAGLFGAWVQGQREHSRWIRERRLDAYTQILTLHNEVDVLNMRTKAVAKAGVADSDTTVSVQRDRLIDMFPAAVTPLAILGPTAVSKASDKLVSLARNEDSSAYLAAENELIAAMRSALKIDG